MEDPILSTIHVIRNMTFLVSYKIQHIEQNDYVSNAKKKAQDFMWACNKELDDMIHFTYWIPSKCLKPAWAGGPYRGSLIFAT